MKFEEMLQLAEIYALQWHHREGIKGGQEAVIEKLKQLAPLEAACVVIHMVKELDGRGYDSLSLQERLNGELED